jgi:RsiW-degrading membrane proteinase PrsW (M82 family)
LRAYIVVVALAALGLALLFDPALRSDPQGSIAWFTLLGAVVIGLVILGVASFVIRSLVKSRRAVKDLEERKRAETTSL